MAQKDIEKYQFDSKQSRTKAAENGRKGGIASGKAKREKGTATYTTGLTPAEIRTALDNIANDIPVMKEVLTNVAST